jgi:hypothetical protein
VLSSSEILCNRFSRRASGKLHSNEFRQFELQS